MSRTLQTGALYPNAEGECAPIMTQGECGALAKLPQGETEDRTGPSCPRLGTRDVRAILRNVFQTGGSPGTAGGGGVRRRQLTELLTNT